jgi:hypothetical protein
MLALTFMAAFGAAGIGVTNTAEAWRGWGRPYRAYYGPRAAYYAPVVPYRRGFYGGRRIVRPYYYSSYYAPAYPDYYYYGPGRGVTVSFGY